MKFKYILTFIISFLIFSFLMFFTNQKDEIKVGLLYSKSGVMAINESQIGDGLHLAVKHINDNGGILGKKIAIIEADGKSNPNDFALGAKYLVDSGVSAIFGCWTSASRKAVKPIVEKADNLLFYPVQHEGIEVSPNIVYLGLSANQQINPVLNYAMSHFGKNIFLIGSDYIYPKMANLYIKEFSKIAGFNIVGEEYKNIDCTNFDEIATKIKNSKADFVINTLNGQSNKIFFENMQKHNIKAADFPIISLSLDEANIEYISKTVKKEFLAGHLSSWVFFDENIKNSNLYKIKQTYNNHNISTDVFASTYYGMVLLKQAIEEANSIKPSIIKLKIKRQSIATTKDKMIYIDSNSKYAWLNTSIVAISDDLKFKSVWNSATSIEPLPFPQFRHKEFWEEALQKQFVDYNNSWQYERRKK